MPIWCGNPSQQSRKGSDVHSERTEIHSDQAGNRTPKERINRTLGDPGECGSNAGGLAINRDFGFAEWCSGTCEQLRRNSRIRNAQNPSLAADAFRTMMSIKARSTFLGMVKVRLSVSAPVTNTCPPRTGSRDNGRTTSGVAGAGDECEVGKNSRERPEMTPVRTAFTAVRTVNWPVCGAVNRAL